MVGIPINNGKNNLLLGDKNMDELLDYVQKTFPLIEGKRISADRLVFEERVKMNCFYCGKYNTNWRCPPKIPPVDCKKMFSEYDNAAFIYVRMPLDGVDYNTVRNDSSIYLHRALLLCEKWLYQQNNATALSFIGGSCKLCKNGCVAEKCANPYQSRSPVEALGINVVKSAEQFGIRIHFPATDHMMRIGLLLW
jgi:predicted metal-binding protein